MRLIAEAAGKGDGSRLANIVRTSLTIQLFLGVIGAGLVVVAAPAVVTHVLRLGPGLAPETTGSLQMLALSVPILLWTATLRGILEAHQRFELVNAVRFSTNPMMFVLPAIGAALGIGLIGIVLLLLGSLLAAAAAYLVMSLRLFPEIRHRAHRDPSLTRTLFTFGGWVTVASLLVPVLVYSDRLLIPALVSVTALAYYTVAFEIVFRLQVIPSSFASVLFPAFTAASVASESRLADLFARSVKYLLLVMGPSTLLIALFARPLLKVWIGDDFAQRSSTALEILAAGVLLNSLSQIPAQLLDAIGRPDLRAKLFMLYGPVYLAVAAALILNFGISGAALAWTLRAAVELVLFTAVAWLKLRFTPGALVGAGLPAAAGAYAVFAAIGFLILVTGPGLGWIHEILATACFGCTALTLWLVGLNRQERSAVWEVVASPLARQFG